MPMIQVGNIQVPDPKVSNPELFDAKNLDSPIVQFAQDFGIQPENVGALKAKLMTGVDKKQYVVMNTRDDYPLLIAIQNAETGKREWTSDTMRPIFDSLGIDIGAKIEDSLPYNEDIFRKTINENFNMLFCAGPFDSDTIDKKSKFDQNLVPADFRGLADEGNSILYVHPGFVVADQEYLKNKSKEEVIMAMKQRIADVLQYASRVNNTHSEPTYVNIYNEPFVQSDNNPNNVIWKNYFIPNEVFGRDAIVETYMMFWDEAQARSLTVGKDVFFTISEYSIDRPDSPRTNFAYNEFEYTKEQIAGRLQARGLSITKDQVPLDLAMELRLDENIKTDYPTDNPQSLGRWKPPTEEELTAAITRFKQLFPNIHLTEVNLANATSDQRQEIFAMIERVAFKTGVKSISFEEPLRFNPARWSPDQNAENTDLFTPDYGKSVEYFNLVKQAFLLSTSQTP